MHTLSAGSRDSPALCNTRVTRVICLKGIPISQSSGSRGRPWDLHGGPLNDSHGWGPHTPLRTTSPERMRFCEKAQDALERPSLTQKQEQNLWGADYCSTWLKVYESPAELSVHQRPHCCFCRAGSFALFYGLSPDLGPGPGVMGHKRVYERVHGTVRTTITVGETLNVAPWPRHMSPGS